MEITKKNDSKRSQVWWFFCLHSFLPSQNASRVHEASTCCVWRQEEEALILILMMILGEKKCRERERIRVSMEFPKNNSNRSQVWWFFFLPSLTKCIKNPWSFHLLCEDKKQKPLTLIMIQRERENSYLWIQSRHHCKTGCAYTPGCTRPQSSSRQELSDKPVPRPRNNQLQKQQIAGPALVYHCQGLERCRRWLGPSQQLTMILEYQNPTYSKTSDRHPPSPSFSLARQQEEQERSSWKPICLVVIHAWANSRVVSFRFARQGQMREMGLQSAINSAQTSLPLPSTPLFRRNVSKWQCRRLLVLLVCFTKSAGNVWPRNQCHKTPIQQRITDKQMMVFASERAIAKHARQTSRAGDRVYVLG